MRKGKKHIILPKYNVNYLSAVFWQVSKEYTNDLYVTGWLLA